MKETIKQRKRRSGLRKLPVSRWTVSSNWRVKLAQQNPLISARAGGHNAGAKRRADRTRYCYVADSDGNVGISGGNSGARESTYTITIERLPVLDNPVKTSISCFSWTDAIDHGPQMTAIRDGVRETELDVPIKFIWNYVGIILLNQHSDINKTHEILQDESKCEMIVVIENFMTSSAKYAEIVRHN
ncbi:hypothetical protein ACNKHR_26795 [Shigella flexneri]